jgi:hypothetical protein
MKYIKTITVGNNVLHKFVSEVSSFTVGKKNWKNRTLSIAEAKVYHCGQFKENVYRLVIRYDNSPKDCQISQFGMSKEELIQFRDVINSIISQ